MPPSSGQDTFLPKRRQLCCCKFSSLFRLDMVLWYVSANWFTHPVAIRRCRSPWQAALVHSLRETHADFGPRDC